jgi:serine protease Do
MMHWNRLAAAALALLGIAAAGRPFAAAAPEAARRSALSARELSVFQKSAPQTVDDLATIERRIRGLSVDLMRATVAVGVGQAQGSGVIVSADGFVLTAAHVAQVPGREATVVLSDGRHVEARTLGLNRDLDCGLLKITTAGQWPHAEIGKAGDVVVGDWCMAMGHPRGYHEGRAPVLRLGRIVAIREDALQTDCTLAAGDSGGPLFDIHGRVIGVHSRIGPATIWNLHVPASTFVDNWDRLTAAERWGRLPVQGEALLGVRGVNDPRGCRINFVAESSPAETAGLKVDDVIVRFDSGPIASFEQLLKTVREKHPGDRVTLGVLRGDGAAEISVVLTGRE